jgi:hypothetical protein
MVNVSEVVEFCPICALPNAFPIVGGAITVVLAAAIVLVPASVVVDCTLLFFTPAVVPCTLTTTVHEPLDASDPPDKLTLPEADTAVTTPPHEFVMPFGVATTRPAGNVSVNARPLSAKFEFGLVFVNVSDVVPLSGIVAAPKPFVIVCTDATVSVALAVLPVPPFVELTAPDWFMY